MKKDVEYFKNYVGDDEVVHYQKYLLEVLNKTTRGKTFRCGFEKLDSRLGGLQTGEVVTISGHTKNGKTLFAESWLNSIRKTNPDCKTMILSFENQPERLLAKYVKGETKEIYLPKELKTMDFEWLKERCIEAIVKYNCNVVLIDHLHFLVDMNTKQNMSLNIGAFMRRLKKEIAMDLNMGVMLIAHQSSEREGQLASARSIRDSSFIGQESDVVICINRKKDMPESELGDKYEMVLNHQIELDPGEINDFSQGLSIVSIERSRRTGVYEYKKLFQKRGEFLEET